MRTTLVSLFVAALAACAPVMPTSDAGDAQAVEASSADATAEAGFEAPLLGTWEYRGTTTGPRLDGGTLEGPTFARATFRPDGVLEAYAEMSVNGCVVHTETVRARYRVTAVDVIFIEGRVCSDVDTSNCPQRTFRLDPANPCYVLDGTWVRNTNPGDFTVADGTLVVNRAAPWTRAR